MPTFQPALDTSAGVETGEATGPEVPSVTRALTIPPAPPRTKVGGALQVTTGAVRSILKDVDTGAPALPAESRAAA